MRRKDREVKDFDEIISILDKCKVLHLAMISEGKPYSVPVNFGYIVSEENGSKKLSIYIHGAGEGKKVDALKVNPQVCFSAECGVETDSLGAKETACDWTCYYESVIGSGKATFLDRSKEKTAGLDALMMHNGYKIPAGIKVIAYEAMALAKTMVCRIEVEEITGKRHKRKS